MPSPSALGLGAIGLVIATVLVVVVVAVNRSPDAQAGAVLQAAPASLVRQVTEIPERDYERVGLPSEISDRPTRVKGERRLTKSGLPVLVYIGAEFCPYCAFERWALVMALSKFGTFSGLSLTNSSVSDAYPDTATFSFYSATYKSRYLVFEPYELASDKSAAPAAKCNVNGYACMMTAPASYENLLATLPPGNEKGGFPFIDFSNVLVQDGSSYDPGVLADLTADQIARRLGDLSSAVATAEIGAANYLTAGICAMTHGTPSDVCSAPYVKSGEKSVGIAP